ncbi:glycerophosphodiester phosphodiesterase family protein [Sunxiuqinia elliptica]|nr:glycerophosphodiester phosphodiesterase family protein [Sunxiuqinia elliptica]
MRQFSFLLLFLISMVSIGQNEPNPTDFSDCNFTAVAHRGYSEFYPENTLISIEEAFKRGIKYCEVDVAISSDNVYVLHHDPYTIKRTTSGNGEVSDNTYEELAALDAGKWKAQYFTGEKVPTLIEALKLAQQYDACLYLDIKEFDAEALEHTLKESGVDPERMMPAITTFERAVEFNKHCPDSPWLWFGPDPTDPNDQSWYEERVALGCRVFEFIDDDLLADPEWTQTFIEKAHASGAKVWGYTINNEVLVKRLVDMGVDGVETDRPYVAQLYVCGHDPVSTYPKQETTGNWDFKKSNFENTGIGSRLKTFVGEGGQLQPIEYGTTNDFGISLIAGRDTVVAKIPAYNSDNGLFAYDNFMMEDSGAVDFSYSIIMDILVDAKDSGKFISLIQTSPENLNDADFFIAPDAGLGTYGEYHGEFTFDEWHRIIFIHDGYLLRKYLDGQHIGDVLIEGSRWALFNNMAYHGNHGLLFFADNDEETAEVYVNALQLRNYVMSPDEIVALGGAKATGIPVNNKKVFSTGIEELDSELVDWERQIIFIKEQAGQSAANLAYELQLSYGATTSIPESGVIDLRAGEHTFQVTAADGSSTNWTIKRAFPVGVDDLNDTHVVQVYPNPFNHLLHVKMTSEGRIKLANLTGQVLLQRDLTRGENTLMMDQLPAATYIYSVQTETGTRNGVLIKSN